MFKATALTFIVILRQWTQHLVPGVSVRVRITFNPSPLVLYKHAEPAIDLENYRIVYDSAVLHVPIYTLSQLAISRLEHGLGADQKVTYQYRERVMNYFAIGKGYANYKTPNLLTFGYMPIR